MATGYPDWMRAILLLGETTTGYKVVAVDDDGNLNIYIQGEESPGVFHVVKTDDDGRMIIKIRGRDGNYVVVDAAGNMTTVIKGWDGAALKTVKVDDVGRLSAFVIDSTDAWGRMLSVGNAELAVRLGSPVAYDRRGQVILFEDWEQGQNRWVLYKSGGTAGAWLDPTTSATGGYSMRFRAGTDVSRYSWLMYRRGALPVGRVGLEFSFAVPGDVQWVFGSLFVDNGTDLFEFKIRWLAADDGLYIWDTTLGMTSVGTGKLVGLDKRRFNTIKAVADLEEEQWVRLMYNRQEIDISAHPLEATGSGSVPRVSLEVGVYGTGGADEIAYIDDVILTFGEP